MALRGHHLTAAWLSRAHPWGGVATQPMGVPFQLPPAKVHPAHAEFPQKFSQPQKLPEIARTPKARTKRAFEANSESLKEHRKEPTLQHDV